MQSFAAWECILVDNESRDRSTAIAVAACREDRRFRILFQRGDLVAALNAGIHAAAGPYIARMDADDLSHRERLARQVALFHTDPSLSIVSCLVACFGDGTVPDGMQRYVAWLNGLRTAGDIRNALFVESPLVHPTVMMRREAVLAAGGYQGTAGPEDYDLWMRLLLGGHRAAKVPAVLLQWRDSAHRLTRSDPRYDQRRFFETKLRYVDRVLPTNRPIQICGAGPIGRSWARALGDRSYSIRCFIDVDPRKQGRLRRSVPVEGLEALQKTGAFVLAAVGQRGAREQIETYLEGCGLRPWDDFLAVA